MFELNREFFMVELKLDGIFFFVCASLAKFFE